MKPRKVTAGFLSGDFKSLRLTKKVKGYLFKYSRLKFVFIPKGTRLYRNHVDYDIADRNIVLEFKSGLEINFKERACPSRPHRAIRMAYKLTVDYCNTNIESVHNGTPISNPRELIASAIEQHGVRNQYKKHADYFEVIE